MNYGLVSWLVGWIRKVKYSNSMLIESTASTASTAQFGGELRWSPPSCNVKKTKAFTTICQWLDTANLLSILSIWKMIPRQDLL